MSSDVGAAYDAMAEQYVAFVGREFTKRTLVRERLEVFAAMVAGAGPVADLGCGPGHVTKLLSELGLTAVGYDISEGLLSEARRAFPELTFHPGDLTRLAVDENSLAGIVSRHSTIHLDPECLPDAFDEWARVAEPGAPLYLSFFAAAAEKDHGTPFDHAVTTAYALFPATIVANLKAAGFVEVDVAMRRFGPGERPLDHGLILARLSS